MVKKNEMLIGIVIVAALLLATGTINFGGAGAIAQPAPGGGIVGCALSTTQTIANATYNADKPGTALSSAAVKVFTNPATGALNPGGLVTTPGGAYTLFFTASNYFSTEKAVTTGCVASPVVSVQQKAVDTVISKTAYENNGITALSATENLTIGTSGSSTAHIKLAQSAAYTHLSGESGKFFVGVNVTAGTQNNYAPAQMSAVFDGVPCVAYTSAGLSNSATPTVITGVYLTGWVCTGDFAANDGSIHELAVRYAAASGVNPGAENYTSVNIVGIDRYLNDVTGVLESGAVTNSGAAIQAMQTVGVGVD